MLHRLAPLGGWCSADWNQSLDRGWSCWKLADRAPLRIDPCISKMCIGTGCRSCDLCGATRQGGAIIGCISRWGRLLYSVSNVSMLWWTETAEDKFIVLHACVHACVCMCVDEWMMLCPLCHWRTARSNRALEVNKSRVPSSFTDTSVHVSLLRAQHTLFKRSWSTMGGSMNGEWRKRGVKETGMDAWARGGGNKAVLGLEPGREWAFSLGLIYLNKRRRGKAKITDAVIANTHAYISRRFVPSLPKRNISLIPNSALSFPGNSLESCDWMKHMFCYIFA